MSSRKSFIIHKDSLSVLDDLDDAQAGRLFKAIKAYQDGAEIEVDPITRIALSPFKSQFERDLEKYESIVERNKNNGLKGGRPGSNKENKEPKKPTGLSGNPNNPAKADSDSDSDSDSEDIEKTLSPDGDETLLKVKIDPVPHKDVIALYAKHLPMLQQVKVWNERRGKALKARWFSGISHPEHGGIDGLAWWDAYFSFVANCPHLLGHNDREWQADLEWLINEANLIKVIEGRYRK